MKPNVEQQKKTVCRYYFHINRVKALETVWIYQKRKVSCTKSKMAGHSRAFYWNYFGRAVMSSSSIYCLYGWIIVRRWLLHYTTNCTTLMDLYSSLERTFINLLMLFVFGLSILNETYHVCGSDSLMSYSIKPGGVFKDVLKTQKNQHHLHPAQFSLRFCKSDKVSNKASNFVVYFGTDEDFL